jgi:hypothetical protein
LGWWFFRHIMNSSSRPLRRGPRLPKLHLAGKRTPLM